MAAATSRGDEHVELILQNIRQHKPKRWEDVSSREELDQKIER